MSFNKEKHLRANIEAIKLVFQLEREQRKPTNEEQEALKQYSGFGALKCILNPVESLSDIVHWSNSEIGLFPLVSELHDLLKNNAQSEQQYKQHVNSLKNSIVTAFYTPPEIVQVLAQTLKQSQVSARNFLDPSAGMGAFISAFKNQNQGLSVTGFEKDLLTGKILSKLYPEDKIRISGFEEIENRYNNHFDVVSSNIPFGDVAAFDISFLKSTDKVKRQATRSIHNYFFLKGMDTLREGGILAFITSQGVMNSPKNEPVRHWLMNNSRLVSAVRLPNNLFSEYAGTEVGSDLIILQKETGKNQLTQKEKEFVQSDKLSSGVFNNNYFNNFQRVVHTEGFIDTDPYGKPAQIFIHNGGIKGIASDLKKMLEVDFRERLDVDSFQQDVSNKKSIPVSSPDKTDEKENQPELTLYDLFGLTQEERTQNNPVRRRNSAQPRNKQLNLFPQPNPVNGKQNKEIIAPIPDIRPFSGELHNHLRTGSLVKDQNQIGFLKDRDTDSATFERLKLSPVMEAKALLFIQIRDTYHQLYNNEAESLEEDTANRNLLNSYYDDFVRNYGNLNDHKNLGLLKMDSGSNEVLALERGVNGELVKADIFHQPVAFNAGKLEQVKTSEEALAASLNKFGEIRMDYMLSLLDEKSREELVQELHGKIYFNPLIQNYEVADKFIAGNVVEKVKHIEDYLSRHPNDITAQESLKTLQDSIPKPISFEELDFNFGERWIPANIYSQYASHLFKTSVDIHYSPSVDEFSVKPQFSNANIYEKYAIKSQSRLYDGIALMKHALVNTTPNITKKIFVDDKEVKVRDSAAIQLANSKIDEIRNGFTQWLNEQSPEFKQNLAELYNSTYNCYVRPKYDGSHQTFPGLDLKALGIPNLYSSQKDAIWMLKQNGGGICDHEVGSGKTLIMCCAAFEMKRLQWQEMERTAEPEVLQNPRFQLGLIRAYYDAYQKQRLMYENVLEYRAMEALRNAGKLGTLQVIEQATKVLNEASEHPVGGDYKLKINELYNSLFRGASPRWMSEFQKCEFVERIDVSLNNSEWLLSQFDRIKNTSGEPERLQMVHEILNRTNPGPGGFYDNLGTEASFSRVKAKKKAEEDPGTHFYPRRNYIRGAVPMPVSWKVQMATLYEEPLVLIYENLDPNSEYKIRINYTGGIGRGQSKMKLIANGEYIVHDFIDTEGKPIQEFDLPRQAYTTGKMELSWTCGKGERGSPVAEVWIIKK